MFQYIISNYYYKKNIIEIFNDMITFKNQKSLFSISVTITCYT